MADTPFYVPDAPKSFSDQPSRDVAEWVYNELLKLSKSFSGSKAFDLQQSYVAPTRPREGMIVHADGTRWNPGSGQGTYSYAGGAWKALTLAGTVTSVTFTAPSIFSVSGSPITTSGTIAVTLANQNANLVFAGPSSGGASAPTFRAAVEADLSLTDITTNDASTSKHGFLKKLPNTASTYLDGTGAFSTPQGNLVLLATLTASASASLSDTTHLTSTYKEYEVHFFGMIPAAAAQFQAKVSVDGGTNWLAASYVGQTHSVGNGAVVAANFGGTFFPLSGTVNASANYGLNGMMRIFDPAGAARRTFMDALMDYQNSAGTGSANFNQYRSSGYQDGANTAINAIQFSFIGQNITSGVIKIYGVL